ncbi:MAG: phosphoribosylformylglycinamidine synthase I [Phycisphaerae bacterium]|nr:phosphoribosylformylglycinamidine synthase I [Phycisphaerae bacterium]
MTPPVRVLVLRTAGINCDEEIVHCWRLAGAEPVLMHLNAVAADPSVLHDVSVVTIPGGFSYGDDIAAGAILAQRILQDLADPLRRLVERGGGILGVCNGFQTLVKAGLLPGGDFGRDSVTVTFNDRARFEARWVRLEVCADHCVFLNAGPAAAPQPRSTPPRRFMELPVEHAEGRVITASAEVTRRLGDQGLIALRYVDESGRYDSYPANPNGSVEGIAGLCDATGRILGLMPHPDRHFVSTHHPLWTRRPAADTPDGLAFFLNAVEYWRRTPTAR